MITLAEGWHSYELLPGIAVEVFHRQGTKPGPKVLITGGIHGDEYEGPAAAAALGAALAKAPLAGSVTILPVANPPAFASGTRTNPDDGLNLARCFPGRGDGRLTERLAAALFETFAGGVDCAIDLHSGGVNYLFLPVAGFYGEAHEGNASYRAARAFGLPHLWALPATAGVLSHELWRLGAAAVGCEYLGAGQLSEEGVAAYVNGMRRCLAHWGVVESAEARTSQPVVLEGDWVLAGRTGLYRAHLPLGALVKQGARVACIQNVRGEIVEEFYAPRDGVVAALRSRAFINQGDWGVLVLGEIHAR